MFTLTLIPPTPEMQACGIPVAGDVRLLKGEERRRYQTIYAMVRSHGLAPGHTCGECRFLHYHQYSNRYFKCSAFGREEGPSSDWRKRWPACGKFESKEG